MTKFAAHMHRRCITASAFSYFLNMPKILMLLHVEIEYMNCHYHSISPYKRRTSQR